MNYTHINTLDIVRFRWNDTILYKFRNTVNQYRDQSDDFKDLGRIGLSVYNSTMLISLEK
jgi:hypothetical protein